MENRAALHFLRIMDRFRFGGFQQYKKDRINNGVFADKDLTVNKVFEQLTKRKTEVKTAPKAPNGAFLINIDEIKSLKDDLVLYKSFKCFLK